jgi:hypothetical protein
MMQVLHATKRDAHTLVNTFGQVLLADGPDFEGRSKLDLFAWLVGDWEFDITTFPEDGTTHTGQGEICADWVLQGRAIQDVWMIPRREQRTAPTQPLPVAGNWYGTTLRVYDPGLGAWRILWTDPATNNFVRQIGRAEGNDIVQDGEHVNGTAMRWRFTEITPSSFHWIGEFMRDESARWERQVEVFAKRM